MKSKTGFVENQISSIEDKSAKKRRCSVRSVFLLTSVIFSLFLYHVHFFFFGIALAFSLFLILCCNRPKLLEFILYGDFESLNSIFKKSHTGYY